MFCRNQTAKTAIGQGANTWFVYNPAGAIWADMEDRFVQHFVQMSFPI